jgi:hypothetical protein
VLKASFDGMSDSGPAKMEDEYSDWKTVDGITLPGHAVRTSGGKEMMTYDLLSFQVNPTVDPTLFQKPTAGTPQ